MSTQLILYPQNYRGFSGSGGILDEVIVDGVNFTTINSSLSITGTYLYQALLTAQPPSIVNTWYRARTNAAINYPKEVTNTLVFNAVSGASHEGCVYQRLSQLTVGAVYEMNINLVPNASGICFSLMVNSATAVAYASNMTTLDATTSVITTQFTAQTSNDIFMLFVWDSSNNDIILNSISIRLAPTSPSLVNNQVENGQVICDLYQEEDIPLTLSVDNFTNVAEKIQSYSKDFNLPATKRNNQIFNNMFEITRADDGLIFNPYIQTKCTLKQDGILLFEGYLRLINIKDKNGEISYNVNLYSDVVALADTLKDKKFSDLDLSELQSDYTYDAITDSWDDAVGLPLDNPLTISSFAYDSNIGLNHTNVMKYPFIDWNHQFWLDTNSNPVMPNLNSAFRPCIQIKYLINKIFSEAGFTWTSNFFNTSISNGGTFDFDKLFMDFNWGNDENPTDVSVYGNASVIPSFSTPFTDNFALNTWSSIKFNQNSFPALAGYNQSTGAFTVPAGQGDTTYTISADIDFCFLNYVSPGDLNIRWLHNGNLLSQGQDTVNAGDVTGSAIAYANIGGAGGQVLSVNLHSASTGGYYSSVPTVGLGGTGNSGTGAAITAVCPVLPGPITSFTVTSPGTGYSTITHPKVIINNADYTYTYSANFNVTLSDGDTLIPQFQTSSSVLPSVMQDNRYDQLSTFKVYDYRTAFLSIFFGVNTIANPALLNTLRGELGQWDFIKGIMTMFNLVSLPDSTNQNNIFIEPYSDVFVKHTNSGNQSPAGMTLAQRSIEHDWTDKVDVSQMELKPLTDLNRNTVLKFVEDGDDYCFKVFQEATFGGLYGAKYWDASGFTILEGEKEIVAEPFAATIIKPLQSGMNDFFVPSIYAVDEGGSSDGFENSPRIFYNDGVQTLASSRYTVPAQNGVAGVTDADEFLQFSHLSSIPINSSTIDFNFESQQLFSPLDINGIPTDNLFNTYWLPYFRELYHPDTRIMTLRVNLSPSDINTFKFYDTVMIKNRAFRVNKIEYKPNALAKVEFILIG